MENSRVYKLSKFLLAYPKRATQARVDMCLDRMKNVPQLAEYREQFARRLSKKYRHQARQKYVESIIRQSELGQDIAEIIAKYY